jgi:hypothetical protein
MPGAKLFDGKCLKRTAREIAASFCEAAGYVVRNLRFTCMPSFLKIPLFSLKHLGRPVTLFILTPEGAAASAETPAAHKKKHHKEVITSRTLGPSCI